MKLLRSALMIGTLCAIVAPYQSHAVEVYFGGGGLRTHVEGTGTIAWFVDLSDNPIREPFDAQSVMLFTPDTLFPAYDFHGLGWEGNSFNQGRAFFGMKVHKRIAIQVSLEIGMSISGSTTYPGFWGPTYFEDQVTYTYHQSAVGLESRLFPGPKWLYALVGLRRSSARLSLASYKTLPSVFTTFVYDYNTGSSYQSINPVFGLGVEYFPVHGIGGFLEVRSVSSDYRNFDPDSPDLNIWPQIEFDNGGLFFSAGISIQLADYRKF